MGLFDLISSAAGGPLALMAGGSDIVSAYGQHREAVMGRDFNADQAQQNRAFEERLSGSAHQREVADLSAAGLNPILSGRGGGGSSTPSGATASTSIPSFKSEGISTALSAARTFAEIDQIAATTKNIRAALPGVVGESAFKVSNAKVRQGDVPRAEVVSQIVKDLGKGASNITDLIGSGYFKANSFMNTLTGVASSSARRAKDFFNNFSFGGGSK